MHLAKQDIPTRIDVPGAVARQQPDFGSTTADEAIGAEYFSLAAGTDIAPLLVGLENDLCQSPHWGYLISGEVVVSYLGGESEQVTGGHVFFWPSGHSVAVLEDAEIVLFSPRSRTGRSSTTFTRSLSPPDPEQAAARHWGRPRGRVPHAKRLVTCIAAGHEPLCRAPPVGLEPTTLRLTVECSAN